MSSLSGTMDGLVLVDYAELADELTKALRAEFFSGVRGVRPRELTEIGKQGAELFSSSADESVFAEYGRSLSGAGLGPRQSLVMTEQLYKFYHLNIDRGDDNVLQIPRRVTIMLESYIFAREEMILADQERTRRSFVSARAT